MALQHLYHLEIAFEQLRYVCKIIFDSTLILVDKHYYRQYCCIYKAMLSLPVHPPSPNLPLGLNPEMSPHIWHIPDLRVRALVSMQAPAFLKFISRNLSYLNSVWYETLIFSQYYFLKTHTIFIFSFYKWNFGNRSNLSLLLLWNSALHDNLF